MPAKIDYAAVKAVSFEDVLVHYGRKLDQKSHPNGDEKLDGYCPICHPNGGSKTKNNQFQVTLSSKTHPDTANTFHCFSCGARGTVIDFVVLMEGLVEMKP